jgi:hypothetical protein
MYASGFQPRSRRSLLRRWLLLCVVAMLGQASAPVLAWCLHDAGHGAHLESALTDCSDHVHPEPVEHAQPCHDSTGPCDHLMLDAQTPGTTTSSPAVLDTELLFHGGLRLSLDEWLVPTAGPTASAFLRPPAAVDARGLERLVGQTTHLLI